MAENKINKLSINNQSYSLGGNIPIITFQSKISELTSGFYFLSDDDALTPTIFKKSPEGMATKCYMFAAGGYYLAKSTDEATTINDLISDDKYCVYRVAYSSVDDDFYNLFVKHRLRLGSNPTQNYDAATKLYVDTAVAQGRIAKYGSNDTVKGKPVGFIKVNGNPFLLNATDTYAWLLSPYACYRMVITETTTFGDLINNANAFLATTDPSIVTKKFADQTYTAKSDYNTLNQKVTELESTIATLTETISQLQQNSLTTLDRQTLDVIEGGTT